MSNRISLPKTLHKWGIREAARDMIAIIKDWSRWTCRLKTNFGSVIFLSCLITTRSRPAAGQPTFCHADETHQLFIALHYHAMHLDETSLPYFFLFSLTSTRCLHADACKVPWWCYMPSDLWLHRLISTRTNFQHGRHIQISIFYVLRNLKRQMNQINTGARNISMCKIKKDFIRIGYFSLLVNPYVLCILICDSTLIACIY